MAYRIFLFTTTLLFLSAGCSKSNVQPQKMKLYKMEPSAASSSPINVDADIHVIDMIPQPNSGETNQDSEPNISVNRNNIKQVVGSAFTPGPFDQDSTFCPARLSPIYVSMDSGDTWSLNCIVPTSPSTFDITLAQGHLSGNLYAGILLNNSSQMQILRAASPYSQSAMAPLLTRSPYDQPYIEAALISGAETIFVGENNCCGVPPTARGKSANIDASYNPNAQAVAFTQTRIEKRDTTGADLASIRVAVHESDGVVYGLFFSASDISDDGETFLNNVVLVRDDHGGVGANRFENLVDPSDQKPGKIVALKVPMPSDKLGQQRLMSQSHASIAVDPRNVAGYPLYVAWGDSSPSGRSTIHIKQSNDKGVNWFDRQTIANATNPALAVNEDGIVALLFQEFDEAEEWETHLWISADGFGTKQDFVLSKWKDNSISLQFDPFIGDYIHLSAVGKSFFGVFSASNEPNYKNFPFTETFGRDHLSYQRDADFDRNILEDKANNVNNVPVSIDPFFVRINLKIQ
jgi:hypothetical protein